MRVASSPEHPFARAVGLAPRLGPVPVLPGHEPAECARLDSWAATVPVLGAVFRTAPASNRGLLIELNRGRQPLRPLSLLDVLAILYAAGGGSPGLSADLRTLLAGTVPGRA